MNRDFDILMQITHNQTRLLSKKIDVIKVKAVKESIHLFIIEIQIYLKFF